MIDQGAFNKEYLSPLKSESFESRQNEQQQPPRRTFGNSLGSTLNSPTRNERSAAVGTEGRSNGNSIEEEDGGEDCIVLEVDTAYGKTEELRLFRNNNPKKRLEEFAKKHNMSNGQVRTILDYINSRFT